MRKLHLHRLSALLLLAACGSNSTSVQVTVTSVTVTAPGSSVEVGLTLQFDATATGTSGAVSGLPVTWASSAEGVATISTDGVATGVSVGSTQISATIGGVSGETTLTVEPAACATRTDVVLAPGEHMSVPASDCLLLPAGSAGDVYRVAIARPSLLDALTGDTATVTLDLSPVLLPAAASAPRGEAAPSPAPPRENGPKIDGTLVLEHLRLMEATSRFETALRLRERELGLDPALIRPDLARAGAPLAKVDPPPDTSMYLDLDCNVVNLQPVHLIAFDDNLAIYQDSVGWAADSISVADANEMFAYYDSYAKDMITEYWGPVPDTDGNGRVIVVTSQALDDAAAAVYTGDYANRGPGPGECASSNEAEVIYFQDYLIRDLDDPSPDYYALGVVAHEMKHVVSVYNSLQRTPSPNFNEIWIEEGTAVISQVMSSRIAWWMNGGPAPNEAITATDIFAGLVGNPPQPTPEMSAVVDGLGAMVRSLSAQPNSVIHDPDGAPVGHSFYATSWLWHRFLGDGYGQASSVPPLQDAAFFKALVSPTQLAGGAAGELQLTGLGFDELFEEFVVALSFHGTGYHPTHEIDTWDFLDAAEVFSDPNPTGRYPWPVTATDATQWALFTESSYSSVMGLSGVRFHDFRSSGTASAQVRVAAPGDAVIIVSRIE